MSPAVPDVTASAKSVAPTRQRLRMTGGKLAAIAVLAAVLAGVAGLYRWITATPDLRNSCSGLRATEFEMLEAAGATEYRVAFRQDERLGLLLCVHSADAGVEVQEIRLPAVPDMLAIQPVGVEDAIASVGKASPAIGDEAEQAPGFTQTMPFTQTVLWFEMEYCNIVDARVGVDTARVDYRYRGRNRSATVALGFQLSIDGTDTCTKETWDLITEESRRWADSVPDDVALRTDDATGPFGLTAEAVSRDLCRYLGGIHPVLDESGNPVFDRFKPLESRAVFRLDDVELAGHLVDGAVLGICPEFGDRRDELHALLPHRS
jgi:hypothetical protein